MGKDILATECRRGKNILEQNMATENVITKKPNG